MEGMVVGALTEDGAKFIDILLPSGEVVRLPGRADLADTVRFDVRSLDDGFWLTTSPTIFRKADGTRADPFAEG